MRQSRRWILVTGIVGSAVAVSAAGCGSKGDPSVWQDGPEGSEESTDGPGAFGNGGPGGECVNLSCRQHECENGGTTSVSGVVYDPAGKNPLYNVVVYVPNAPVAPLPQGASCDSCNALYSGSPLVSATTNARGEFTLTKVPDGADIPLVVQVGKWRRQLTIPNVARCRATSLPDKSVRLPRNGGEGDIPQIAIATGNADSLECLLRRVGLDASEYASGGSGGGHLHIFQGPTDQLTIGTTEITMESPTTSPRAPSSSKSLWHSRDSLAKYDILLLSCEGSETRAMSQQSLFDYAASGGRVFASHFHYAWFNSGPFGAKNLATWKPGTNSLDTITATIETKLPNGAPFPKGQALAEWLEHVGALTNGELPITEAKDNATVTAAHTASQAWITAKTKAPGATQYFTFNTPLGVPPAEQCGRVVYSDLHVGAASGDHPQPNLPILTPKIVPSGCKDADLSAQEKALEFMLFDLSSCVTPDNTAPTAPPAGLK